MRSTNRFLSAAVLVAATVLPASRADVVQAAVHACGKSECKTEKRGDQTCEVCKTPVCERRTGADGRAEEVLVGYETKTRCESAAQGGQPIPVTPVVPRRPAKPAKPEAPLVTPPRKPVRPGVMPLTVKECADLGGQIERDNSCPLVYERQRPGEDLPPPGSRSRCKMKDGRSSCIDAASP